MTHGHAPPRAPRPRRQRGVAAVTALLIVAIASVLAANMLWRSHLDQRRTEAALTSDQAWLYLRGAEFLAAEILRIDLQETGPDSDHLGEIWAQEIDPLPVDGGFVQGALEDMQGRFNINNLVDTGGERDDVAFEWFQRLLAQLEIDPEYAGYVVDWIDANQDPSFPVGAEDDVYTSHDPPYRPPNLPVTSTSELLAMEGFDADTYDRLAPLITALPRGTRLNVNTAPAEVLASLADGLSPADAESLVDQRGDADFPDFVATFGDLLTPEMMDRIDERSSHFRLTARVSIGSMRLTMYSLLERDSGGSVRPLLRSLGTD